MLDPEAYILGADGDAGTFAISFTTGLVTNSPNS